MGSIYKRTGKSGVTWYISYYVEGEQHRERVGRQKDGITERMAKEALKSREGAVAQGRFDLAQSKTYPQFTKLMEQYLDYSKAHKKSYERDTTSVKHLQPFFGNKRINDISPWLIEKYKMKRKEELKSKHPEKEERDISFTSINRELSLLKHFFTMSIKWGKIDKNPVKGIKTFKERSIERYLEEDEMAVLIEACGKSKNRTLTPIVITALNTGMRLREVLYLRTVDLDFKNSIINIEDTKNGERGKVPMNDYLKGILQEHLKGHNFKYVFCDPLGKPYNEIRGAFKTALDTAGIKNFRFHDLRHTFASQLALKGVDLYTIQQLGRWKTLSMVTRYAHLSPQHRQNAVNKLSALFGNNHELSTNFEEATNGEEGRPRKCLILNGAGGGARTHTTLRPRDFESRASTSFTTPALEKIG